MLLTRPKPDFYDDLTRDPTDTLLGDGNKPPVTKLRTVLLVEDDDALREGMEACLGMMGYGVIPCPEAQTACAAFRSSWVDILLTDLQMPGRSGVELARELTLLSPALPVMIISGSLLSDELSSEIQRRHWRFLSKPCHLADLDANLKLLLRRQQQYAA